MKKRFLERLTYDDSGDIWNGKKGRLIFDTDPLIITWNKNLSFKSPIETIWFDERKPQRQILYKGDIVPFEYNGNKIS